MRFLKTWLRFLVSVQLLPALESGEETLVGGQAVLEGVMMRSPHAWAIACRKPSGEISTHSEPLERLSEKHKWMGWPIVRGVITLGHAMTLGFRALRFSANVALDETPANDKGKKLEVSGWMAAINIIFSVGFFIFMYKFLPLLAATELAREGFEIEVIDLRTVKPLDTDTVLASVARTGRLLAVGESFPWGGVTAEVIARVASAGFHLLDAAPARINAKDTPIPYHPNLWSTHRPNAKMIAERVRKLLRE